MLKIGVLVSGHGRGSNLQAILDACSSRRLRAEVAVVIGTRSDAPAMARAHQAGVSAVVISPRKFDADDEAYGAALINTLAVHEASLICLAGYMRILPPQIVHAYHHRILNVHPALLPLFGGKGMYGEHVHAAVLESGMKVSGATVHLVDEHYDSGPIVAQECVRVEEDDDPQSLAARVLPIEHALYVKAISYFAEDRIEVQGRRVLVRNVP